MKVMASRLTSKFVLDDDVDEVKQRSKKGVVCFVCQQEAGSRHGGEELNDLRTRARRRMLDVWGDVAQNDQESGVHCIQISFACCDQSVDRLPWLVFGFSSGRW